MQNIEIQDIYVSIEIQRSRDSETQRSTYMYRDLKIRRPRICSPKCRNIEISKVLGSMYSRNTEIWKFQRSNLETQIVKSRDPEIYKYKKLDTDKKNREIRMQRVRDLRIYRLKNIKI